MIYWFIHIPIIGLISYFFYRRCNGGLDYRLFIGALLTKLVAGLSVGAIFHYYYGAGDTISFFEKSKELAALPLKEYWEVIITPANYQFSTEPRVLFFTKFLSIFTYISGESYWISSMYLSLLSFASAWYLTLTLSQLLPHLRSMALVCFLFIPTIVFWSSGILKDALAASALFFAVAITLKKYYGQKVTGVEWILSLLGLFVILKVKHYILITFIIFLGTLIFISLLSKSSWRYRAIAALVLIVSISATQFIHPYLKFERLAFTIYENNQAIQNKTTLENKLDLSLSSPSIPEILTKTPKAAQIGLLRPAFFDDIPLWGWFHRIENTILTFLMMASLLLVWQNRSRIDFPLVVSACFSILILAILLALSTPNFGTLVRYKNAFLPFLFLLCSILPYQYFSSEKAQ